MKPSLGATRGDTGCSCSCQHQQRRRRQWQQRLQATAAVATTNEDDDDGDGDTGCSCSCHHQRRRRPPGPITQIASGGHHHLSLPATNPSVTPNVSGGVLATTGPPYPTNFMEGFTTTLSASVAGNAGGGDFKYFLYIILNLNKIFQFK